jgi:hypothetical protein
VVVDHQEGAGVAGQVTKAPCQRKELGPAKLFLAQLKDAGATAESRGSHCDQAIGVLVGSDDVEASGEEAVTKLV